MAARVIARRFALSAKPAVRLGAGLVGLAFLLAAECIFAAILQNLPSREYITNRDPVSGAVFAIMLALYALMPLMKR